MDHSLWNAFETVRDRLVCQYEAQEFPADTGLDIETLERGIRCYIAKHSGEPRIRLRAEIFSYLIENARIRVDPFDLFADHIAVGSIMTEIREEWRDEVNGSSRYDLRSPYNASEGDAGFSSLDLSHTSPGWKRLLKLGVCGIRDEALNALKDGRDDRSMEFLSAVAAVYESIRKYILRLAAEARRVGTLMVAASLDAISKRPPQSFHEALQLSFIYSQMQEIEGEYVRTQGTFDQLYIDYYRSDIASGRLTRDQAKELVKFFFEKFSALHFGPGHNICLGGRASDGSDLCNELTELALEAFEERQDIDPKLSLRVHSKMPARILDKAANCVRKGLNAIVFANHDVATKMFLKSGKDAKDIDDFVPVGCYEPAIMGKELCCSMSAIMNFAKVVEQLFSLPEEPKNIAEVMDSYRKLLAMAIGETLEKSRAWERKWKDINPSPVMAGTIDSCIERGLDVSEAGAKYNSSGVVCVGIGTVADSMAAIDHLVFKSNVCSWRELGQALAADWKGYEELRTIAKRAVPKWGNDIASVDDFAVDIAAYAAEAINHTGNARNGFFQMGCWSIDLFVDLGKNTGATPDGRMNGDPISKNAGASIAFDSNGVTALINSASKLDHTEFPDGSCVDIILHPSVIKGNAGTAVISSLIKTYFAKGGLFMHFNILDAAKLRQAQAEPGKFRNLQIRVCGWNTRFVDLSPEMQELFILQSENLAS